MSDKEFPEIKKENQGKFTRWVEKNMPGMDTCKAASKIMRSRTKKYSPAVVKMANYANNFGCKTKKEDGASKKKLKGDFGKTISAKKFERKAKRNKDNVTSTGISNQQINADNVVRTNSKKSTVVNKKRKRFVKDEYTSSVKGPNKGKSSVAVSYYKQRKGKHY